MVPLCHSSKSCMENSEGADGKKREGSKFHLVSSPRISWLFSYAGAATHDSKVWAMDFVLVGKTEPTLVICLGQHWPALLPLLGTVEKTLLGTRSSRASVQPLRALLASCRMPSVTKRKEALVSPAWLLLTEEFCQA